MPVFDALGDVTSLVAIALAFLLLFAVLEGLDRT